MSKNTENLAIVYDLIDLSIGALGGLDVAVAPSKIDASRLNGFRVMKTEYFMALEGYTAGEGPVVVGMAMLQDDATIEQGLEADPQSASDLANNSYTKRPVWPLEIFTLQTADGGKKGSFNPRWSCPEGQVTNWWVYNLDGAALTIGCMLHILAKHYGVWLRD